jgi:hypothetical protein
MAFNKVVLNAVVAAQYHAGHKPKHFFRFGVQCALRVCICIQVEQSVDHQVLLA